MASKFGGPRFKGSLAKSALGPVARGKVTAPGQVKKAAGMPRTMPPTAKAMPMTPSPGMPMKATMADKIEKKMGKEMPPKAMLKKMGKGK